MKTMQPLQLSTLTKNYKLEKKNHLVISYILGFPLSGGRPLLEADLWTKLGDAPGEKIPDMGMPKPNGEVLVHVNYHAPDGQPVTAGRAVIQSLYINKDKELAVIGKRNWRMIDPTKRLIQHLWSLQIPLAKSVLNKFIRSI